MSGNGFGIAEFTNAFDNLKSLLKNQGKTYLDISKIASKNERFRNLCIKLENAAKLIQFRNKQTFIGVAVGVKKRFIEDWREYEAHYKSRVQNAWAAGIDFDKIFSDMDITFPPKLVTENGEVVEDEPCGDSDSKEVSFEAENIKKFIEFAISRAFDDLNDDVILADNFQDFRCSNFCNKLEETGIEAIKYSYGFDIESSHRRQALLPFFNLSEEIVGTHGSKLNLSNQIKPNNFIYILIAEAQRSFILGNFISCAFLIRQIIESIFKLNLKSNRRKLHEKIEFESGKWGLDKETEAELIKIVKDINDIVHLNVEKFEIGEQKILEWLKFLHKFIEVELNNLESHPKIVR